MSEPPKTPDNIHLPDDESAGGWIGHYRLLQELGEGGFGTVWSAQQEIPVRRTVAVKILKLGMDSKQVVARFESERQALAVMDHPCIAKVFDGGITDKGRPYFVMELVKGVTISRYCDDARLTTAARLDLFRQVCHAVQHAHQKGIIHRDLKPSNILVALQDGVPHPKIIDFGIAKAVTSRLTDLTMVTQLGQMIGTPEYMAPEQAALSGLDVDTRADVYSLGVVLYELLTGTKPFELGAAIGKGYSEILRIIREVEPPKPSTRISTLGAGAEPFARQRGSSQHQLGRALRGDLDWIVMKALDKDRSRRYSTVAAFAEDIESYLSHRPVSAAPPSTAHRLTKYVRRHRIGVAAAGAIFVSLIAGLVATAAGYREASAQRDAANDAVKVAKKEASRSEQVVGVLNAMLGGADPYSGKERDYTLRQLLDDYDRSLDAQLTMEPEVAATVRSILGRAYRGLGENVKSEKHLGLALDIRKRALGPEHVATLESQVEWVFLLHDRGEYSAGEKEGRQGLDVARRVAPDSELVALFLYVLGTIVHAGGEAKEAEPFLREALALREKLNGPDHRQTGNAMFALACVLRDGDLKARSEAESLLHRRIDILRKSSNPDHPNVAMALDNLGRLEEQRGDLTSAVKHLGEAIDLQRRRLGDNHPDLATSLCTLANLRKANGEFDEAEKLLRDAAAIYRAKLGDDHPDYAVAILNLAILRRDRGDLPEALLLSTEACEIFRKRYEPAHPDRIIAIQILAGVHRSRGDLASAEGLYREVNMVLRGKDAPDSLVVTTSSCTLAMVLTEAAYKSKTGDKAEEAVTILREVVNIRVRTLGAADWRVVVAESLLADALAAQGANLDEARGLALQSWPRLSQASALPAAIRRQQERGVVERIVRILDASQRVAPGSVDAAVIADWKNKLDAYRPPESRPGSRPASPVK